MRSFSLRLSGKRPRTVAAFAAVTASVTATAALALPAGPSDAPAPVAAAAEAHVDNPFAGASAYVNPDYAGLVDGTIAKTTDPVLRSRMRTVKTYPTAVWLDRIAAIQGGEANAGRKSLRDHLDLALTQKRPGQPITASIVVYDLPGRDCAALASNGELPLTAAGLARYKSAYIDPIADVFRDPKYADVRITTVIEPDGLPNLVTNLGDPECQAAQQSGIQVEAVRYALNKLHAIPNVYTYLDFAHSGWLGWDDNLAKTTQLYTDVAKGTTAGLASVDGLITNVSNYTPIAEPYLTDPLKQVGGQPVKSGTYYQWNGNFDESDFTAAVHKALVAQGWPASTGMLVDTSRNGWGGAGRPGKESTSTALDTYVSESKVDRRAHRGLWCNTSGAGLGAPPQASPQGYPDSHIDAFVWVKPPGESDGASKDIPNDEGKRQDPMCDPDYSAPNAGGAKTGALPDAPLAGHWFDKQFEMLVKNAYPAVPATDGTGDTEAPTAPTGLRSTGRTATSVSLSWTAATDNIGVTGYDVYRGATKVNSAPVTGTVYTDSGLTAATAYGYTVRARDAAGNTSPASAAVAVTTDTSGGGTDTQAPSAPGALTVSGTTTTSVSLTWSASTDNTGVTGYDVYRGTTKANSSPVTGTVYTDSGLTADTAYGYTVRARDAAGNVSAASTAATARTKAAAAGGSGDWLHTSGNQIVDEDGNKVWLTGTNWFGFNATERVFHGLWSGNITRITKSMADRGINIVRVPISTQLLLEWKNGQAAVPSGVNTYANPELKDLTTLQVFDHWLALCESYGIKVMLDVHSAEADNSGHIHPVWWKGAITTEQFYSAWEWITDRYKSDDTIVAMDVKNEPHGKQTESPRAKWDGSTDQDNFKYACQTAGRRILAVNPKVLVLCEGIEIYPKAGKSWSSTAEADYHFNWWGGNLRGAEEHPVDLGADQDQLVYSPHDYGPLVFQQPWFQGDWNRTTLERDVWDPNWLYLHKENTSPLLIGEWGGFLDNGPNQKWMTALRDLIAENRIHQTFWCLNPNSGDTGGLLLNDWETWDEAKYALLKPALWQSGGKFVSLDHQVRLGGANSTTGISLADLYGGEPPVRDTQAPSVPGGLTATARTATSVTLAWTAATDNVGVTGYDVYRGTTKAGTATTPTYTDTGLTAATAYSYTVRAKDAAGNTSAASTALSVTTDTGGGSGTLLSQGRNATASSSENGGLTPDKAVDGDVDTRWASAFQDNQWINVDLGSARSVDRVILRWEAAYARGYRVQISNDPNFGTWTDLYATTTGDGGTDTLDVRGTGRYVRVLGQTRATPYGISLYELQVYGT